MLCGDGDVEIGGGLWRDYGSVWELNLSMGRYMPHSTHDKEILYDIHIRIIWNSTFMEENSERKINMLILKKQFPVTK